MEIPLKQKILSKNDQLASDLRALFNQHHIFTTNLVSSPGSGKTELLSQLLKSLQPKYSPAAITGDLATQNDADRLAVSGAPSHQILTGTMCHLESDMISTALQNFDLDSLDFLFIENVGNLVCPGNFDLGEHLRIVLVSTTEGEDKPLKYAPMFHTADLVVINKIDLAQAVGCDIQLLESNIHQIVPDIPILHTSAKTGKGVTDLTKILITKRSSL